MSSVKIINSAPVETRIFAQDATYTPDRRVNDDWSDPATAATLAPGASATLALSPLRRLLIETTSAAEVTVALDNQERTNPIRVATQAKHGKGYEKPAHHLFLQPRHAGNVFGRTPEGSPEASVGFSSSKRIVLTLMPS